MGRFTNSVLLGVGISFLFAPRSGRETRQILKERFIYLRGIPPENKEMNKKVQEMSQSVQDVQEKANRAAQMGSTAQNYAQETARSANSIQNDLGDVAGQTGSKESEELRNLNDKGSRMKGSKLS